MKFVTPEEAVRRVKSHGRVFIRGGAAAPLRLINAMTARAHELRGVEVVLLHTTTRAHVHYVVTEYGAANLHGRNLRRRGRARGDIARPDHRQGLARAAHERFRRGVYEGG